MTSKSDRLSAIALALLPALSFTLQWAFSARVGREEAMLRHITVTYIDWAFVPFNYFAARTIDWRRGERLFAIAAASVVLNVAAHAFWQAHYDDEGHMISAADVTLPAGWVHLAYATIQATLLAAFLVCRRPDSAAGPAKCFATCYFVGAGVAGYVMNDGIMITDALMVSAGLAFTLVPNPFRQRVAVPARAAA